MEQIALIMNNMLSDNSKSLMSVTVKPGFHYTTNTTTTTQKQSDYKVEHSSLMLIALF